MLMPSIFGENLFDDFFTPFYYDDKDEKKAEKKLYGRRAQNLLKTDIKEKPEGYELIVDVPGFKKDEVKVALKDGYLTVSAAKGLDEDDEDKKGHYIRRERYAGACERSFYEVLGLLDTEIVSEENILELMDQKADEMDLILTGLYQAPELWDKADEVTVMQKKKP